MKERGFGRIINIGSEVFELGNSRFANYVAAKGAQLGLTLDGFCAAHDIGPPAKGSLSVFRRWRELTVSSSVALHRRSNPPRRS
jgi:hypothetical protein